MKHFTVLIAVFALFCFGGCFRELTISPAEPVVIQPSTRDFGLCGIWQAIPSADFVASADPQPMTITMNEAGIYTIEAESLDKVDLQFRVAAIDDELNPAIVEIEQKLKGQDRAEVRLLAIADRSGDRLSLRFIESPKLAECMNAEGYSAVIEHGTFITKVHAKPEQLLACVRKHSDKLAGNALELQAIEPKSK